jgi:DNA-binding MarR family transcriptional regulator
MVDRSDAHDPSGSAGIPGPTGGVRKFTPKQGQYLAFIHTYMRLNGRAPAEADMLNYFSVTPPTVHQMVLTLEKKGLIAREPGMARSIRVLVPPKDLPALGE